MESVLIQKEIKSDVEIEIKIDSVKCDMCRQDLEHSVEADGWGDLQITVEPCSCNYVEVSV
tara:strand:+ start:106 stop:288 length:183 start_codon:yes stop_codon:yes gene_type:complete